MNTPSVVVQAPCRPPDPLTCGWLQFSMTVRQLRDSLEHEVDTEKVSGYLSWFLDLSGHIGGK
jgi:hypothetical protein